MTGPKCDQCKTTTTSGLFPTCQLCGECASRPQTLVIDPIQREVDFLLRGANASGVYRYRDLEWGAADRLRALLDRIEAILATNGMEVDMLTRMVQVTHDRLSNLTVQVRLLYGTGARLLSRLIALEQASAGVLEETRVLRGRLDGLAVEYGIHRNSSSRLLASSVDYAPLLRLARDSLAASNQTQRLLDLNITRTLSDAHGFLLSSAGELSWGGGGFENTTQRLLAKLQSTSLELDAVEGFLHSASVGLCGANTTVDCPRLCGRNASSPSSPCNDTLYVLALRALEASREAWSVTWATWRRLEEAVWGFGNVSLILGQVNASSLVSLGILRQTSSGFVGLIGRLRALAGVVRDELGTSREDVGVIIQLENATLEKKPPISQTGVRNLRCCCCCCCCIPFCTIWGYLLVAHGLICCRCCVCVCYKLGVEL